MTYEPKRCALKRNHQGMCSPTLRPDQELPTDRCFYSTVELAESGFPSKLAESRFRKTMKELKTRLTQEIKQQGANVEKDDFKKWYKEANRRRNLRKLLFFLVEGKDNTREFLSLARSHSDMEIPSYEEIVELWKFIDGEDLLQQETK